MAGKRNSGTDFEARKRSFAADVDSAVETGEIDSARIGDSDIRMYPARMGKRGPNKYSGPPLEQEKLENKNALLHFHGCFF